MFWNRDVPDDNAGRLFEDYCLRFLSQVNAVRSPEQTIAVDGLIITKTPDIMVEDQTGARATVECKWGSAQLSPDQYRYYLSLRNFEPVFVLRGDGTDPSCPDSLYLISIDRMDGPHVNLDTIAACRIRKTDVIRSVSQLEAMAEPHFSKFPKR